MTEEMREAFQRVTSGYYRAPDPKAAAQAFEVWLTILARVSADQTAGMIVLMYLFGRIAQRSPEARAAFAPMIAAYTGANRELASGVLRALPEVLAIPVDRPEILDLLWAEFFVTGERAALLRIVSALDARDMVREKLTAWLGEHGRKRDEVAAALAQAGLVVNLERGEVATVDDLDRLVFAIAEQQIPIVPMLPFALSESDVMHLGMKGSALWSLRLNAATHTLVATVCREEATRPGGVSRRLLAEPLEGAPFAS